MVSLIFHWTIEHGNLMFFFTYIFSVYRIWSDHAIPSSFVFALVILPHARIVSPGFLSLFFHSASYSSFFPRMCIIFIDVIIAFLFSRVDFPYLCVTRVHARARAHVRQKERMRAYPRVYVLCLWIHTRFFLWLCCHIHALVRIVCVSLRVRVSVMVSDRKKGGAERGKEQGRSICV